MYLQLPTEWRTFQPRRPLSTAFKQTACVWLCIYLMNAYSQNVLQSVVNLYNLFSYVAEYAQDKFTHNNNN